jgi:hypothetical protein
LHRARLNRLRDLLAAQCVIAIALLLPLTLTANGQRIFFAERDPVVVKAANQTTPSDYMQLFTPNAPWSEAAAKVMFFNVSTQFILSATDDQLRTVFNDLKRRHIKAGVEMGTVIRLDTCGLGEGYAPQSMATQVAKRLHGLGLQLDFLQGDEPVTFTHLKTEGTAKGRPNCAYPLSVVADRTMMTINDIRAFFPNIEFGDIEVAALDPHIPAEKRLADYVQFAHLMQQRLGHKLAYFHADVAWRTDPLSTLAPMRQAMKVEGIPFGIVIAGSPKDTTDLAWEQDALSRLDMLERNPATQMDDLIVDSWQTLPAHILPETTPGTSTNVLLRSERIFNGFH